MAAHVRTCPTCAVPWSQVAARFCGRCGGALPPPGARGWTRPSGWVVRIAAGVGVLAVASLAAGVATVDLGGGAEPGPRVEVGDGLAPGGTPLSDEEAADLVARADPDWLRCEPRTNCELWRLPVDEHRPGSGVVAFDDVALLLTTERALAASGEGDAGDDGRGHAGGAAVLVAVDVATGQHRWRLPVAEALGGGSSTGPAQLVRGAEEALLVTPDAVVAIGRDGELAWRWGGEASDDRRGWVWDATVTSGVVLVRGAAGATAGEFHSVTALDEATGAELWSADVHEVMHLGGDLLLTTDAGQRLRSLDPATGALEWSTTWAVGGAVHLAGPWIAAETARNTTHLLDPSSGEEVARVGDYLISDLVPAGDGWVGVTADTRAWVVMPKTTGEVGILDLVLFAPDGAVAWTADLGTHDPWVDCCEIHVEDGTVTIGGGEQRWEFDLASGELLASEEVAGAGSGAVGRSVRPTSDREVRWHRDERGLEVRDADGAAAVRGGPDLTVESLDPVIVRDEHGFLAVQTSPEG